MWSSTSVKTHHGGKLNRCWWIQVDLFMSHLFLFSRTLLRKRSCAWPWTAWAPSSTSWTTSTGSVRSCSALKRWGVVAALTSSPQRRWRVRPLSHRENVPQSSCLCVGCRTRWGAAVKAAAAWSWRLFLKLGRRKRSSTNRSPTALCQVEHVHSYRIIYFQGWVWFL